MQAHTLAAVLQEQLGRPFLLRPLGPRHVEVSTPSRVRARKK